MHGAPGAAAVGLGRSAFPGEGVAVPAVEGEAAAQFALFACLFVVVPLRAGFGAFSMVGVGAFTQTATEGVVDVVDAQARVVKAYQAVEQVPVQLALLAVVPAADLVAAFVVFVVGASVFTQQVAGRVEGEGFHAEAAGGAEQAADRVVTVGQWPAAS